MVVPAHEPLRSSWHPLVPTTHGIRPDSSNRGGRPRWHGPGESLHETKGLQSSLVDSPSVSQHPQPMLAGPLWLPTIPHLARTCLPLSPGHQISESLAIRMAQEYLFWFLGVRKTWGASVSDAKKRKRKLKPKKLERILFRDRSTSPCQPLNLLPPPPPPLPPLLPPATNVASVVASSHPVYTMPRVFGPFPPLPSKPVSAGVPQSCLVSSGSSLPGSTEKGGFSG